MKVFIRGQKRFGYKGTVLLLVAMLTALLSGCGNNSDSANAGGEASTEASAEASAEPVKVRFALDTAATGSLQFRTAVAQGFFKKHGIEAEVSNFAYGIDTINAMLVERADTGSAADYALLNSLSKGDFKVVSTLSRETEQSAASSVIIAKGDDITSAKDLEGKRLGVVKGTVYEYIWSKYLENVGVDESKVKFVPYSTPDEGLIGMQKGQIDAVIAASIFIEKFLGIKGAHQIGDLSDANASISSYFVVQSKFIEEHPEAVANILKAVKEAVDYIADHKEETAQLAFDEVKLPKEGVLKDLEQLTYTIGFSQEDYEHLEEMKSFIKDKGILKVDYDLKSKLALDPLREAFPDLVTYK
ncbi:ABC-type nitrate/sulfonate/bicarbonate transport system substrate-binding protein [Paenibacillus phyllosphaerae]|uniref:ABC-type nitrate/sulfonate/bicarbonate transport system substrate-binding protein n=1 Tax=Paenibacillus phyllosphaerae TaxID=274593 RepID=A0A7W5AUR2_9BACL|nr:ABC transporter substrate-binding protein [Paenibacillus phyllosphaerae]MBB3108631.1 ABC-type nitrate/sulfonate/bicarbonate transport system substrate-binding protein [Paenibacillus phyllosphaerae]